MKYLPETVLVAVAVAAWWLMRDVALTNDVGWQFWIARQMLRGTRIYEQIWEVNPPLWFWSAMPLEALAERAGWEWGRVLVGAVVALAALSAWLTAHLLALPHSAERLATMLLVFTMTAVLNPGLTGQREQLALIAALPYAALIARRLAGIATAPLLGAGVAVGAAYGFALKHYFLTVPLLLEVWMVLRLRARWRPWRPELVVLAVLAVAYAAAVVTLAPGFFTINLPMVEAAYFASQQTMLSTLAKVYPLIWGMALLFLWATRRSAVDRTSPAAAAAVSALVLTWLGFAIGYVLQSRGWDYHTIAATGAIGVAVGLVALRLFPLPGVALAVTGVWAVSLVLAPPRVEPAPEKPLLDRVAPGQGVYIAYFDASVIFQRGREDRVWVSRSYSLWMVYAIAVAEAEGRSDPALARLEAQVLEAASADLRCNPPQLVVMRATPSLAGRQGEFSFDAFLRRDSALARFLDEHYTAQIEPIGTVYWRHVPVPRAQGLACRTIR